MLFTLKNIWKENTTSIHFHHPDLFVILNGDNCFYCHQVLLSMLTDIPVCICSWKCCFWRYILATTLMFILVVHKLEHGNLTSSNCKVELWEPESSNCWDWTFLGTNSFASTDNELPSATGPGSALLLFTVKSKTRTMYQCTTQI